MHKSVFVGHAAPLMRWSVARCTTLNAISGAAGGTKVLTPSGHSNGALDIHNQTA